MPKLQRHHIAVGAWKGACICSCAVKPRQKQVSLGTTSGAEWLHPWPTYCMLTGYQHWATSSKQGKNYSPLWIAYVDPKLIKLLLMSTRSRLSTQ